MQLLLRIADRIDRFQERSGKWLMWLTLAMVLIGSFNAVARYFDRWTGFGLSSNMYLEMQWYLFSLIFLLGGAYALRHDAHVRVDILYTNVSRRTRALIDLGGVVLFLVPFCLLMLWVSWPSVINSWAVLEMSPDPGGLPRYPIKTIVPIAFLLLLIQGVSMGIRAAHVLFGDPISGDSEASGSDTASGSATSDPLRAGPAAGLDAGEYHGDTPNGRDSRSERGMTDRGDA